MATTQQDVIKKFMSSLDKTNSSGTAALNEAIKACSNSKYTTIQSVIDQMVADCQKTNNATNFLKNYCGIDLSNKDTGAITGADAGGSMTKTAESIVPEDSSFIALTDSSFRTNGLTFQLSKSFNSLTSNEQITWQALYSWYAKGTLDLIADSYGANYGFDSYSSATVKNISVSFANQGINGTIAYVGSYPDYYYKTATKLDLVINMSYYQNMSSTDVNGKTSVSGQTLYLDRTLAHEMTHAVMSANINYFYYLPQFVAEGLAELTHGVDDERYDEISMLATNATSLKQALSLNKDVDNYYSYAAGFMFFRYLAKQLADVETEVEDSVFTQGNDNYANLTANTVLSALGGDDSIKNNANNVTIHGNAGNDTVSNWGGGNDGVHFYGGDGKDIIKTGGNKNYISTEKDDDYIYSWGNNNTLLTGEGNDSVDSTGDKALIEGGAGKDSLFASGTNSTVKGGEGDDHLYSYVDNVILFGENGNDYISTNKKSNTLYGGAGNDTLSSYGEAILIGGDGNDTIRIDNNKNLGNNFIYYENGNGNDIVYGYKDTDSLSIAGAEYTTTTSGSDVIVNVGTGSVTLVGVAGLTLNILGTAKTTSTTTTSSTFTEGNDTYSNTTANTLLSALGGDDSIKNTANNVTIYGNAGNDSLFAISDGGKGSEGVYFYGGDGNDIVDTGGNKNYISTENGDDWIYSWGDNGTLLTGEGNDSVDSFGDCSLIDVGAGSDFIDFSGSKSTAKGGNGDDKIHAHGANSILFGENGNDYLTAVDANNTLYGGAGNDTISVDGKNSYIAGGTDNDIITLTSSAANNTIQYTNGDGNDIVYGFKDSDTLAIAGAEYTTTTSGSNVIVNVGNGAITLVGAAGKKLNISGTAKTTQTSTTPATQTSTTPSTQTSTTPTTQTSTTPATQTSTTPTTQTSTTPATQTSTTSIPSGLNVSGVTLIVEVSFGGDLWMTANPTYQNDSVKNIDASKNSGDMILTGNSQSNSIKSGSGQTSLWGGGSGNNTLIGGNGRNQFWYTGGGKDVVTNFSVGVSTTSDVVVLAGGNLQSITRTSSNVAINLTDGNYIQLKTSSTSSDEVILYSTDGENIFGAKIANSSTTSLSYTSTASYYQLNQQGNLIVNDAANNNVWLDGSQGQIFANITNINASSATGQNILAGNGVANSIIGGNGTSSLWGGVGNVSDTLTGGNGADMFWYGKNDGADFINNAAENDTINLYDVGLNDINFAAVNITSSQISMSFTSGGTLNINNNTNLTSTFKITEGSFKFNRSTNSWQSA